MLLALLVLFSTFLLGYSIAKRFFKPELFPASIFFGILFFTWTLFLFSLLFNFSQLSIYLTVIAALVASFILSGKRISFNSIPSSVFQKDSLAVFIASLLFIGYSSIIAIDFSNGFSAATQDFPFHLGIIASLSENDFPPTYPNFSQQSLSYYYFIDLFAVSLAIGGFSHFFAFQLLQTLLISSAITAFYMLSRHLIGTKMGGGIAIILIFLVSPCTGCQAAGAAGFASFFPPEFENLAEFGTKGFPISPNLLAFPFSQLPLAFSFLFFALFSLYLVSSKPFDFTLLGITLGLMPMFHLFFFLIFIFIIFVLYLFERKKELLYGIIIAIILAIPQIFILLSDKANTALSQQFFLFELFAYSETLLDLGQFWLLNIGFHLILAIIGLFLWKKIDSRFKAIVSATLIIFVIANVIAFAPYRWDSNKLLLPFLLLLPIFSAYGINELLKKGIAYKAIVVIIALLAISSSYYQFFIYFDLSIQQTPLRLADESTLAACNWIKENTPSNALFIADEALEKSPCIYSVAGRRTFYSVPFWIQSHGFNSDGVKQQQAQILAGDVELAKKYGITHILADPDFELKISNSLMQHLKPVYVSKTGISIYEIVY